MSWNTGLKPVNTQQVLARWSQGGAKKPESGPRENGANDHPPPPPTTFGPTTSPDPIIGSQSGLSKVRGTSGKHRKKAGDKSHACAATKPERRPSNFTMQTPFIRDRASICAALPQINDIMEKGFSLVRNRSRIWVCGGKYWGRGATLNWETVSQIRSLSQRWKKTN